MQPELARDWQELAELDLDAALAQSEEDGDIVSEVLSELEEVRELDGIDQAELEVAVELLATTVDIDSHEGYGWLRCHGDARQALEQAHRDVREHRLLRARRWPARIRLTHAPVRRVHLGPSGRGAIRTRRTRTARTASRDGPSQADDPDLAGPAGRPA